MQTSDVMGSLVLSEDGSVISSTGQLRYSENLSQMFINIIKSATALHSSDPGIQSSQFRRVSIFLDDYVYVVTSSNKKVYVMKRFLPNENFELPPQILQVDA